MTARGGAIGWIGAVAFAVLASVPASAQAPAPAPASAAARVGYVDMKRLLDNAPQVVAGRSRLQREFAPRDAALKADEERLAAQRADNCRRARGHLAALESGQRIARTNERGEREVLDDKGRADEMRQARAVIASDCGARS